MKLLSIVGGILIVINSACIKTNIKYLKQEEIFLQSVDDFSKRKDLIFINPRTLLLGDTICFDVSSVKEDEIKIIAPGINTLNFLRLYKKSGIYREEYGATSAPSGYFMELKIPKEDKGLYFLDYYGCHFGCHLFLSIY